MLQPVASASLATKTNKQKINRGARITHKGQYVDALYLYIANHFCYHMNVEIITYLTLNNVYRFRSEVLQAKIAEMECRSSLTHHTHSKIRIIMVKCLIELNGESLTAEVPRTN